MSLETNAQKIAELTMKICERRCISLGSCCSTEYCAIAIEEAKEFGLELQIFEGRLPLLNPDTKQCTAPPHVRPLCTLHQCDISNVGFVKDSKEDTKKYFLLRQEFELEFAKRKGYI